MKNLFESFKNSSSEVSSSDAALGVSVEFSGSLTITKGGLSQIILFYARTYQMGFTVGNYVSLDDWEVSDVEATVFNGLPIDNLFTLKQTLKDSGLSTLAESLTFTYDEQKGEIAKQISASELFKGAYGKDAIMWDTISEEEKSIIRLKDSISKYDTLNVKSSGIRDYVEVNEEGESVMPSKEELEAILERLISESKTK